MADTLYASLDTIKGSMRIKLDNTDDDAELMRDLKAASRAIDRVTGQGRFWKDDAPVARRFTISKRVYCGDSGEETLLVDGIATTVGMIVKYGSFGSTLQTLDPSKYEMWPLNADVEGRPWRGVTLPYGQWTNYGGMRAEITAVWGWASVPDDIQEACLILARRLFNRKDTSSGVLSSQEWVTNLARRDPDVQALLENFMIAGFG